jgi:hypothetical protein
MAHRNPWKARAAQWRKRWPVPLQELQADAYAVLRIAFEGVTVDDDEQRRKNILCFFQGLTSLAKLLEASEINALAERLAVLEKRLASTDRYLEGVCNGHGAGRY